MSDEINATPQEVIAAIRDAIQPVSRTPEENREYCKKYPFLKWYGDPLYVGYSEGHEIDYRYTWEDELPRGWKIALCPQIWDELKAILEKADYVNDFRFAQIKEKWGALRIYDNGAPKEIYDEVSAWESKYENLSETVCIQCGEPAKYMTLGWISFVCEECAKHYDGPVVAIEDLDAYYEASDEEKANYIKNLFEGSEEDARE